MHASLKYLCCLPFLLLTQCAAGASPLDAPHQMLRMMRPLSVHAGVVGTPQGSGWLVLAGFINTGMADQFKQALANDSTVHSVMIDAPGGAIDAAMTIGAALHERGLRLVVEGQCLSACASYVFPAAARKSVAPDSVVAIHGATVIYTQEGKRKLATASNAPDKLRGVELAPQYAEVSDQNMRAAAYYRTMGINDKLDASFARYLAHRKALFGTDAITSTQHATGCPPYQMWALSKQQLEASGVTGIEDYWYPTDAAQRQRATHKSGLAPDHFYYGAAAGLEQLCTGPLPLLDRVRLWGQRSVLALWGE